MQFTPPSPYRCQALPPTALAQNGAPLHRPRAYPHGEWSAGAIRYDWAMAVGSAYLAYVLEQLEKTGRVTSRRMFGAVGLYCDGSFFAVVDDDTLYFKVNDSTRPDYEARSMQPFRPYRDKPEVSMSYYTVPVEVLDDAEELVVWARRSVAAAAMNPPKRSRQKKSKGARVRRRP